MYFAVNSPVLYELSWKRYLKALQNNFCIEVTSVFMYCMHRFDVWFKLCCGGGKSCGSVMDAD